MIKEDKNDNGDSRIEKFTLGKGTVKQNENNDALPLEAEKVVKVEKVEKSEKWNLIVPMVRKVNAQNGLRFKIVTSS